MKVEATAKFRDLKADGVREVGDRFTVTKTRFKELEKKGLVKEVKEENLETAAE